MIHKHIDYYVKHLKHDAPASIAVFLVALPLCLGIALASGAPLAAGLIAGMIGGLVVSWASGSQLSVSGPAAGLTVIVFTAIETLGSFEAFLVSVVLAGILQLLMGYFKAGVIGAFFPSSVIKAMLSAIGLILIIKQIPHAVGYDVSFEGDDSYMLETAGSSLKELVGAFGTISIGATIIALGGVFILIVWDSSWMRKFTIVRRTPGALMAVIWGIVFNLLAFNISPSLAVEAKHLVSLPIINDFSQFTELFVFPDFHILSNPQVYIVAVTLAIIASLETLLSLEAVNKLDPLKRIAPTNRELKAQGLGNILSGMIGGLPITAVIVRSSANVHAGGMTKISAFLHAVWLLLSILFLAKYMNMIPLAALAAILLYIGFKLVNPKQFFQMYKEGLSQFLPFVITIIAVLVTDLLQGIIVGIVVGLFFVIRANYHSSIVMLREGDKYTIEFKKDVSFLNKALLRSLFLKIPENSHVLIDCSRSQFVDHDIMETVADFIKAAQDDNIEVEIKGHCTSL
ncbi:SulP family inorganic anion transporter [Sulfurimonas sp.]